MILDEPFNVEALKSKRRYEIRKGDKNYEVRPIAYKDYETQLYEVYELSKCGFPPHMQSEFTREHFQSMFSADGKQMHVFGAFSRETGKLDGWAVVHRQGRYIGFSSLRTSVGAEKKNVNFALVSYILYFFDADIKNGAYIDDGSRPVLHTTTNFQDFLEKYYGFRKAYSHLHVKYRPPFGLIVKLLYPFRNLFDWTGRKRLQEIYGVLLQEEFSRKE